jgi:transposase InsO family protein
MNTHSRARLTHLRRVELVERIVIDRWPVSAAAEDAGVSIRTAYKWLARYRAEGADALRDRSSRPEYMPRLTAEDRSRVIVALRRCRLSGPEIATALRMAPSTVAAVLRRAGLARLPPLQPPPPLRRYEREMPGDLVHVDIKKLGRIQAVGHRITGDRRDTRRGGGWEFVHVAIDDATRLVYVEVLATERGEAAVAFLSRARAFYARHGITVKSVMSDNGSCYVSRNFAEACQRFRIRHLRTRPYTPRTNGKAERVIQTLLREWAYVVPYARSERRTAALSSWVSYYNHRRPHRGLQRMTPFARLTAKLNNVSGNHS